MPLSKSKKVLPKQESGCVGVEDGCRPGRVRVKIYSLGLGKRKRGFAEGVLGQGTKLSLGRSGRNRCV